MAIEDLLVKLAKMFSKPKLQTIFLINNYDLTIAILKVAILYLILRCSFLCCNFSTQIYKILIASFHLIFVLKEAGTEGGKAQLHFEEVLKSNIAIYVVCNCID
jgi:hypothetical protein